jgi:hypothetical protein
MREQHVCLSLLRPYLLLEEFPHLEFLDSYQPLNESLTVIFGVNGHPRQLAFYGQLGLGFIQAPVVVLELRHDDLLHLLSEFLVLDPGGKKEPISQIE